MSFESGRVSFARFLAIGDAPTFMEQAILNKLSDSAFKEQSVGAPEEFESGWITGKHLYDAQFTYEKCGFRHLALFAMRLDTHKIPGDVKAAHVRRQVESMAQDNPSGFASRAQKKDAREIAERELHMDLAAGKFRKSRIVHVLWDLESRVVYSSANAVAVIEHLSRLFRETFNVTLEPLSAGALAGFMLRGQGKGRDYENLQPSRFTAPPAAARVDADDADPGSQGSKPSGGDIMTPPLPWISRAIDDKDFLGNEFLMWLWYVLENEEGIVSIPARDDIAICLEQVLDMDCAWGVLGRQALRGGSVTHLAEAGDALKTGKWPRKAGLIIADTADGQQWALVFQGDGWLISGALLPEIPDAENPRQIVEKRLESILALARVLDGLLAAFLKLRVDTKWITTRKKITAWIENRGGK